MDLSSMNLSHYNYPAVSLVVFRLGPGDGALTYLIQGLRTVMRAIEEVLVTEVVEDILTDKYFHWYH